MPPITLSGKELVTLSQAQDLLEFETPIFFDKAICQHLENDTETELGEVQKCTLTRLYSLLHLNSLLRRAHANENAKKLDEAKQLIRQAEKIRRELCKGQGFKPEECPLLNSARVLLQYFRLHAEQLLATCVVAVSHELLSSSIEWIDHNPSSPDGHLTAALNELRWLLCDSKIERKKGLNACPQLVRAFHAIVATRRTLSTVGSELKNLLDPDALFPPKLFDSKERDATHTAIVLSAGETLRDARTRLKGCLDRVALLQLSAICSKTELADVPEDCEEAKIWSDVILDSDRLYQEAGDTPSIYNIFHECLSCAMREAFNSNAKKILGKKKNVTWTLKFGKGCEEFVSLFIADPGLRRALSAKSEEREDLLLKYCTKLSEVLIAKNQVQRTPKVPKGTIDYDPSVMRIREYVLDYIRRIFVLYGGEPIDTPVFELKEILTGKYGEDTKLIYDLKDQGGESLGLRYDLTVPFSRYCATNKVERIKRYHIGKVYRRDEPQINKGRFREFYQCDFDIAGTNDLMCPEVEILQLTTHVLDSLMNIFRPPEAVESLPNPSGAYVIKVSHRVLLDGLLELAGVPQHLFKTISSAIDKLDKLRWKEVEEEMFQKGLAPEITQKLEPLIGFNGSIKEVTRELQRLIGTSAGGHEANANVARGISELQLLDEYLETLPHVSKRIMMSTSLARGLDYYTGLIYEAVLLNSEAQTSVEASASPSGTPATGKENSIPLSVGSIAAGGRYDNLIGMFSGRPIPSVGVSIGIERIFRLIETNFVIGKYSIQSKADQAVHSTTRTDAYIMSTDSGMMREKLRIASELRRKGISAEFSMNDKAKLPKQVQEALDQRVRFGIFVGNEESQKGTVKIREFQYDDKPQTSQIEVPIASLVDHIKGAGVTTPGWETVLCNPLA